MELCDVKENYNIAAKMGSDEFLLRIIFYNIYTAYTQTIGNNLRTILS